MIKIGIIGENYQNDACAFKAFLTPQYRSEIMFVPILKSLNGGTPPIDKVSRMLPTEIQKHELNAILYIRDLDKDIERLDRNRWFTNMQKRTPVQSIFFLAVMELEALILADVETFNLNFGIQQQYSKNPKFEVDPKAKLRFWTQKGKAKRQYDENCAEEIFSKLNFNTVYKKHSGNDSFQAFIDVFETQFNVSHQI